ncbi:MAG: hypothetical protein CMA23_003160 [Methanobacteriota archaeon]|nr:MAG: hypothetical protein CMA23_003160 [Euryarchaeota archaeon]
MKNTSPAILLIVLMLSLSVVGCLSGSSPEASDGTEIELGEPLDDWPTYHVASASNLPTCPGANDENLGKLYYVEDVTEFQACTSSGWSTIDLGSSGISLNQAPTITAQITPIDDDLHMTANGWFYVAMAHWSAIDPEGEAVSIGIDADRDGVIDLNLNSAEGGSLVELPFNGSIHVAQLETDGERFLHLFRLFDVIAEDASGVSSVVTVISPAVSSVLLRDLYSAGDADHVQEMFIDVPQSDIDWLTATP